MEVPLTVSAETRVPTTGPRPRTSRRISILQQVSLSLTFSLRQVYYLLLLQIPVQS